MLVRYRGLNNKGVLERPGTKWRVLMAISSTLKCQFTRKCWKVDFSMPCKTKSRDKFFAVFVRSMRSPWTPPDLPNFNLNYSKNSFCEKLDFNFRNPFFARDGPVSGSCSKLNRGRAKARPEDSSIYTGPSLAKNELEKLGTFVFFTKTVFFIIQVEIGEVWRCPGWPHGPYEDSATIRRAIWSYMASKSPLFNIFR